MSRSALVIIAVEIRDGDVVGVTADQRDPAVVALLNAQGAGITTPRPILRYPKAHALRAAVAHLITAARESTQCTT